MSKLFTVLKYDLYPENIVVTIGAGDASDLIKIPRQEYESWAKDVNKFNWEMDYQEGRKIRKTGGMMTPDEYWEKCSHQSIREDLHQYLFQQKSSLVDELLSASFQDIDLD